MNILQWRSIKLSLETELDKDTGYNACKCIYLINQAVRSDMPIGETLYKILWENVKPSEGFNEIEQILV